MTYTKLQIDRAKLAGKGAFLLTGMGIAPWASIMPFVKENLNLNELYYTFLLLSFGIGAVIGMPLAGPLSKKFGVKRVLTVSFVSLFICVASISIPFINYISCALVICIWGASLGVTEVANNIHGTYFEEISKEHMLSGFHAYETIGCLLAAFVFPILLVLDMKVFYVSLSVCIPAVLLSLCIDHGLLNTHGIKEEKTPKKAQEIVNDSDLPFDIDLDDKNIKEEKANIQILEGLRDKIISKLYQLGYGDLPKAMSYYAKKFNRETFEDLKSDELATIIEKLDATIKQRKEELQ